MNDQPTAFARPAARPRPRRRIAVLATTAVAAAGMTAFGITAGQADSTGTSVATQQRTLTAPSSGYGYGGFGGPATLPDGRSGLGGISGDGSTSGSTQQTTATDASETQEKGLVYIDTTLDYGSGQAAGTGMVLTSDGEILTNHHVVEGATSISVEVVSTGTTYDAEVVGYDATHDVAVLQLVDAQGLATVTTDTAETVAVGDSVTAVGNANGDGGAASAAAGTVLGVDQSITVSSETGGDASRLTGLIEIDADIIAGDSGGALYDDDGEVVGMSTAASSGSADITGYAVPIAQALEIADQIEAGTSSGTVQIGNHGYLGISLSAEVTGALVAGVQDDSPAADAGIVAGSTITSLGGRAVTSSDALASAVAELAVGDRVTVAWTDPSGRAHTETVTLGEGPIG
ncbi:trypsin-like peptidase domain-containing protein [Aeromicrobium sp. CFBP 8757]|uniref:S1C family serine protease n=1 Tax=Aeromicrobium sp. CFBP 8757 TaxID=2775288 RepID=UPI001786FDE6|nr:trypsin-like peptidase domain-containing protein [Aeromicrobium sp. CFBP 8757]MBD8605666.1 trypsin-like peptidase domain-containing protein [Aeromicrobium sp. CFBP 8757]